ncbi:MAG: hypothetical protein A3J58_00385 [Candidatus Sungbacteria bacterium RIFCSPHIGHO2_02_FULL_52_23]|uniref:Uncharacterized protein n=1 Tax=Candidatus Sungbacteria bacterium RIFCSPHIGHO2_02_FULL_52_23 TaxID=1802274 RepID=A0A1G2KWM5_9BACT|nr:MAG: hypothetical protein A3J58_00385 [Candidatus Sungbacteria bacterium RIFCSPHIGHO2_02_FULL_52_23]
MTEQSKQETEKQEGFEYELAEAMKTSDADQLTAVFVKIDEALQKGRILESMYRRPSVSRQQLEEDLQHFMIDARGGSANYLFSFTGGNDRMRIVFENGHVKTEMTQNTLPELVNRWEEIK